jgi:multidrug efflux system outer membrane protein
VKRALAVSAAALALAACTLEPRYVRPAPAIPSTWPTGEAYPAAAQPALPALTYRDVFKDPQLVRLIETALANNQDLRAALANVEVARAQYRVQRAELFPQVDAAGTASQNRGRETAGGPRTTTRNYTANLGLTSFEIDLFGRLRSLTHAAQEQYLATAAGARAARITLVSNVAQAYLTLAADRTLLAIAADTEANAARSVALTEARLNGGVAARTDLTQAQTVLESARSDRAELTTLVAQDRNALELLVGGPAPDSALPASIEAVDGEIGEAPAGLDSRILLRRPDVLEAEHRLRAANAQIGAARAAFFPTISLTGTAGYASPQLSALFSDRNTAWQSQGRAALPIFSGGANIAGLAAARGERKLALANYQSAIQSAFRDVADALARRGTIDDQFAAQTALVTAAGESYRLSEARYREGIDPYLSTLVSQRSLYTARQSLTQTRLNRALNLVALYASIGGDALLDSLPMTAGQPKPAG